MLMDKMHFFIKGRPQKHIRLPCVDDEIKYEGQSEASLQGI
jgi:hypothetical protein